MRRTPFYIDETKNPEDADSPTLAQRSSEIVRESAGSVSEILNFKKTHSGYAAVYPGRFGVGSVVPSSDDLHARDIFSSSPLMGARRRVYSRCASAWHRCGRSGALCVRPRARSLACSLVRSLACLLACLFACSLACSLDYSLARSLPRSLACLFACLLG